MKLRRILKWSARVILLVLVLAFLAGFIAYWRSRLTTVIARPPFALL